MIIISFFNHFYLPDYQITRLADYQIARRLPYPNRLCLIASFFNRIITQYVLDPLK